MATSKEEIDERVEPMCQPCSEMDTKRKADVFCSTCSEFQCNDCSGCHATHGFMKRHTVLQMSDIGTKFASNRTRKADMKGLEVCKTHNEIFKFYCKQHRELLCGACAFLNHRDCINVGEISEISRNEERCNNLTKALKTALAAIVKALENADKATTREDFHRVQTNVTNTKEATTQMFEEFAGAITDETKGRGNVGTTNCAQTMVNCKQYITAMTKSLDLIEDVTVNGTLSERFIVGHSMADIVRQQTEDANAVSANATKDPFNFDEFKTELMSTMDPKGFQMTRGSQIKLKLNLIGSVELNLSSDEKESSYFSDLAFLPDGRLVALYNWRGRLVIYDGDLVQTASYKLPCQNPLGIAVVSDDEVVVTTYWYHKLIFLQVNTSNEITTTRIIDVSTSYYSISLKDREHFVVGTIGHDPPVCIVSTRGEENCFDIEFPPKKYPLDTSSSAYMCGLDKVVLSDTNSNVIYIYDNETGDRVEVVHNMIKEPFGVAVDSSDHVFVCCGATNSIVEVTPCGRVLSSCQLDMKYPFAIAISADGSKIAISDVMSKLNLYKLSKQ